jgi:hypothetical protein
VKAAEAGEGGEGPAIFVGHQPQNQAIIDELNQKHPDTIDAFAVVGDGERLSLVGRSEDSTIWAAWQWLEDQGVRFLMPGVHGTYVPQKGTIEIATSHQIESPRVAVRGGYYLYPPGQKYSVPATSAQEHGMDAGTLFSLRMRMNWNQSFGGIKDNYLIEGAGHSYMYFLPPEKYFKEHPEWFNLIDGKRQDGSGRWQVCFTNKEGAAEFARNLIAIIKRHIDAGASVDRIDAFVSPNDWKAMCQCDNCVKLIDKDGSATSLVLNYANLVAEDLHKVYPQVRVVFYAYDNYSTLPDHVKPAKGVIPILTAWTAAYSFGVNHAHPLFSDVNRKFRDAWAGWSKISDGLGVYTYYGHYSWFTPWPITTELATDIPAMCDDPKFYMFCSETHPSWGTQGLTYWLFPRLIWNPKLDVAAAVKDYCRAGFGPAAVPMEAYYKTLQEAMNRQGYVVGDVVEIPNVLTPEVIGKCDGYMQRVEALMDRMDPDTRWRAELVTQAWKYSAKFAEAMRLFTQGLGSADRVKILGLVDEVDRFSQTDLGRYAFDRTVVELGIGMVRRSLEPDLGALPAGKLRYSSGFMYGGGIKFFAAITGFRKGLWGYDLPVNGSGEMDLPLKAQQGHQITSASVRWDIANPERFSGSLSVVSGDGREKELTTDLAQMGQGVEIPAEMLKDGGTIRLKLRLLNQYHDPTIALTGCTVDAMVE